MKHTPLLLTLALALSLLPTTGWSTTYTFGDSTIYWGQGTPNASVYAAQWNAAYKLNSSDTNGGPDLIGGSFTVGDDGKLKTIEIDYTANYERSLWNLLKPGDLFIGVTSGQTWDRSWDYVVDMHPLINAPAGSSPYQGSYQIDNFNAELIASGRYTESQGTWGAGIYAPDAKGDDKKYNTGSYIIRDHSPVWADVTSSDYTGASALFAGWTTPITNDNKNPVAAIWDVSALGLSVAGMSLTIGFEPNCANDVLLETVYVNRPATNRDINPVPEPSTFAILGLGLGILGYTCNRRKGTKDADR